MLYFKSVLIFTILFITSGLKLPDKFIRCKISTETDNKPNECLKDAINKAILYLSENGDPDLKALPLDPLRINRMNILQSDKNNVLSSNFDLKNVNLIGLKTWVGKTVSGKLSIPNDFKMMIDGNLTNLSLIGEYEAAGRILALPITGGGNCTLNLDDVYVKAIIRAKSEIKNDEKYLKLTSMKTSVTIKKLHSHYENLFNLNRVLGDRMNEFLNDNWEIIFEEIRPSVERAFAEVFSEYTRRIFNIVPYREMFIIE